MHSVINYPSIIIIIVITAVITFLYRPTHRLVELEVDRGLDWEHAMTRYENYKDMSSMTGFYISKREMFGRKMFILVTPKENSSHLFHVARSASCVCVVSC